MTGTTTAAEITAAATTDCRSVSSAGRRSPAPDVPRDDGERAGPEGEQRDVDGVQDLHADADPGDRGGAQMTDHQEVAQPAIDVESEGDDRWPRQRPRGA